MNTEKQIEEMHNAVLAKHGNTLFLNIKDAYGALADAGYRKSTEVAREIFEEIEELLEEIKDDYRADDEIRKACGVRYAMIKVAELKKKYTESEKDNG